MGTGSPIFSCLPCVKPITAMTGPATRQQTAVPWSKVKMSVSASPEAAPKIVPARVHF